MENATLTEIEVAMKCAPNQPSHLRLRAIWSLARGMNRSDVAMFCNVHDHTVLEWINRFNKSGIDGLVDKPRSGAPRRITKDAFVKEIVPLIEQPQKANEIHWTIKKLHGYVQGSLAKEISYSSLLRYVHEQGYVTRIPRPIPEPADKDKWGKDRKEFAQKLAKWLVDPAVQLWFTDESGIEGDPRPRKRWAIKGSKPTLPYCGGHLRRTIVGAVRPSDGAVSTIIVPHCDSCVFQAFLDSLAIEQPPIQGIRSLLVMDNASWHKVKSLNWHHFQPIYLPAYSPDFNPIERLWLLIKSNYFCDFYTKDAELLEARIVHAITAIMDAPLTVQSYCRISANF